MSLYRVVGSHRRRRIRSTLCVSLSGSACLLDKSQALTTQQGLGPRFPSFHHAHRLSSTSRGLAPPDKTWVYFLLLSTDQSVSSPSRGLTPLDKAWVHALPLSTRLSMCPRRFAGSHRATRPWSTLCLSPPDLACLITESRSRTAGQGLGPSFAFLLQAHCFSFTSSGLAPQD